MTTGRETGAGKIECGKGCGTHKRRTAGELEDDQKLVSANEARNSRFTTTAGNVIAGLAGGIAESARGIARRAAHRTVLEVE